MPPYNPRIPYGVQLTLSSIGDHGLGFFHFARRYLGNFAIASLFSIPPGTEMFYFPGYANQLKCWNKRIMSLGFPHSDISGSKVVWHLPEAYRRHTASFIALLCQGIHHMLLTFPIRKCKNHNLICFD